MQKLFGTDGIRGEANVWPMTPEIALSVGKAIAATLPAGGTAVIGGDTRRSRQMLETALASGLASGGVNVRLAGVLPTPAVAIVMQAIKAQVGIAITASHNPASDNGIKIFSATGYKLDDAQEDAIAWQVSSSATGGHGVSWRELGTISMVANAAEAYVAFLLSTVKPDLLKDVTVVLDCANGAAFEAGPRVLRALGAKVEVMGAAPDGMNINDGVGALHPQKLLARVRETGAALGIALDGDADRLVMCDARGVVDGDMLMAAAAMALDAEGGLAKRTAVVTSMSNLGLHAALSTRGIRVAMTDVGDRYVIDRMRAEAYNFGGENSGHLIFGEFARTGDGLLAALQVVSLMRGAPLAEWVAKSGMTLYPQQLTSLRVRDKIPFEQLPELQAVIHAASADLGGDGRVIVRYSGTEKRIRLLVEANTPEKVAQWMAALGDAVRKELSE